MKESLLSGREMLFAPPTTRPGEGFLGSSEQAREKQDLIDQARKRCGAIEPCAGKSWEECFQIYKGEMLLYFNTPDGNTHLEKSVPQTA